MAQRKRFTRVEMARVLMERNQVGFIKAGGLRHIIDISHFNLTRSIRNGSWNFKMPCDGLK